jgi:Fuc2NAc and GlcNAc transferase
LFTALLVGGTLIALIGFWDDHGHIPARWRFLTHLLVVLIILIAIGVPGISILGWEAESVWILFPIYTLGLVWLINLFNFMDGIDGIATIEAVSVLCGCVLLLWLQGAPLPTLAWPMLLAATIAGFLLWNWSPASIFMGDVGSGFLGYVLGCFLVDTAVAGLIPVWSWLILLGVFVVDATLTLVRRALSGARWYEAHRCHAYQHAARNWRSHRKVSLAVLGINLGWLLPLAWLATLIPEHGWLIMVVAMAPLVAAALWLGAGNEDYLDTKDSRSVD